MRAPSPAEHLRLAFLATVQHVLDQLALSYGSRTAAIEEFPFLASYWEAMQALGAPADDSPELAFEFWRDQVDDEEAGAAGDLPLVRLRESTGMDHAEELLWLALGLPEEDARFGTVFEVMQGSPGLRRPTLGLLAGWWRNTLLADPRDALRRWQMLGLVQPVNPEAPRLEWGLQIPGPLWDALRGVTERHPVAGLTFWPPKDAQPSAELILDDAVRESIRSLPALLAAAAVRTVVIRGPQHNGRRTLLAALARELGLGRLELIQPPHATDEEWRMLGPLATLLGAMPVVTVDLAPGQTLEFPALSAYTGPVGVIAGRQGGVSGPDLESAVVLELPLPDREVRRRHWHAALDLPPTLGTSLAGRLRMTGGNIRRVARQAQTHASVSGSSVVSFDHVRQAARALNHQVFDSLARRVDGQADWSQLALGDDALREVHSLERRCRERERLSDFVGEALRSQLNPGVRALFVGPSGTGKTLAARVLATSLGMDLYRLDLSTVVNKYIGETEKNLDRALSRAEELDVILLLDEGDALLTARTTVQSSNDRYANLETNFLLQRLESFEGILIVTTNAGEHIDQAFQRRMDVVVGFQPPTATDRWSIWQLHLPQAHAVEPTFLEDVARRCELRGGQIRNAVLHATLLALDDGQVITTAHLAAAVQREYHKLSAACPLRYASTAHALAR
jgi:hypothetical protein